MKRNLLALLLALGVAGCASHHHARYENPEPPRVIVPAPAPGVVVVPQFPRGPVVPRLTENEAAEIARTEAYRHGWRNVRVDRVAFWESRWHVDVSHNPRKHAQGHGWVEIAPDGTILAFADRPREHAGSYRERH